MLDGDHTLSLENLDESSRLAFIAKLDLSPQSVLATFHRHEVHLVRCSKTALDQLLSYREHRRANQTQSAQVERKPSPTIINMETSARPPASIIPIPEPPPDTPSGVSPPAKTA